MTSGRPAPVAAHLRRSLRSLAVIVPFLALLTVLGVVDAGRDAERRDRSIDVTGTLIDRSAGDGRATVRYVHPVTEQELTVSIPVWEPGRLPPAEGAVGLDADPEDPDGVRLDGDVYPATGDLGWSLPYLAIPLLVWGRRWWGVRRTERLMAAPGPTFAMLGAIAPAGGLGSRTELHLWPLDAAPGRPTLCRVRLLATSHLPLGATAFTVEVKGRPRPFGRLVARSPETGGVLWPAGAALPGGAKARPASTVVPAALAPEVAVPPEVARVRAPRQVLAAGAGACLLGLLLVTAVGVLAWRGASDDRRARQGERVVAEVTGRNIESDALALAYSVGGEPRSGRAAVTYADDYPVGRRYPAIVDPENPSRVRLVKAPYDPVAPVVWASLPLGGGMLVVAGAVWRWRRDGRLARRGPWRPFELWTGAEASDWATLAVPGTGQAVCSVQLGLWGLGRHPTNPLPVPVLVAGDPQPGGRVVVHLEGETLMVRRAGAARRLRW